MSNWSAIGGTTRPMGAFSGFYESHGSPLSGNVRGIVPAHCHGHRNGQQSGHILHLFLFLTRPTNLSPELKFYLDICTESQTRYNFSRNILICRKIFYFWYKLVFISVAV